MSAARERIARDIPSCRIICTLREPVERLYSHYKMWRKLALVKAPFEEIADRHKDLLSYTRYSLNIRAWQQKFGSENVLVLIHEDIQYARQAYVDRICTFIGAEPLDLGKILHDHERVAQVERAPRSRRKARRSRQLRGWLAAHGYWRLRNQLQPVFEYCMGGGEEFPPLDPKIEQKLRRRFEPEVERVEELLGRTLAAWRENGHLKAKHRFQDSAPIEHHYGAE